MALDRALMGRPRRGPGVRRFMRGRDRVGGFYGRFAKDGELKFFETTYNVAAIEINDDHGSINLIPQGVTESSRVGRKCVIKSIHCRGSIRLKEQTTAGGNAMLRVMLVLDKQCNGQDGDMTDVLDSIPLIFSFRDLANTGRFQVLYDKMFVLNHLSGSGRGTTDTLSYGEVERFFKFNLKVNIPIEFSDVTGAIGEVRSNNIFFTTAAQSLNSLAIDTKWRVRFSDGS